MQLLSLISSFEDRYEIKKGLNYLPHNANHSRGGKLSVCLPFLTLPDNRILIFALLIAVAS
jgi:hypothetical protein